MNNQNEEENFNVSEFNNINKIISIKINSSSKKFELSFNFTKQNNNNNQFFKINLPGFEQTQTLYDLVYETENFFAKNKENLKSFRIVYLDKLVPSEERLVDVLKLYPVFFFINDKKFLCDFNNYEQKKGFFFF
jgi:hypothetical protein